MYEYIEESLENLCLNFIHNSTYIGRPCGDFDIHHPDVPGICDIDKKYTDGRRPTHSEMTRTLAVQAVYFTVPTEPNKSIKGVFYRDGGSVRLMNDHYNPIKDNRDLQRVLAQIFKKYENEIFEEPKFNLPTPFSEYFSYRIDKAFETLFIEFHNPEKVKRDCDSKWLDLCFGDLNVGLLYQNDYEHGGYENLHVYATYKTDEYAMNFFVCDYNIKDNSKTGHGVQPHNFEDLLNKFLLSIKLAI